ncbi:MAG: signal peptidase I [Candidatus Izemoplasma sp.]|nr:signal peptidase I [Candidatus Izemoplasma sp.]
MKLFKNVTVYLIYGVLIAYILVSIIIPKQTTDIFGVRFLVVVSNSMEPKINVYDMILIKDVQKDALDEEDIITFEAYIPEVGERHYVTHYLKEINTNSSGDTVYETQGLNASSDTYDEWTDAEGNPVSITYQDIEGVYLFKVPYIGRFVFWLKDPIFLLMLSINGAIFYLLYRQIKHYLYKKEAD